MFGNKNKANMEELQNVKTQLSACSEIVENLAAQKEALEEAISKLKESESQMQSELEQVEGNMRNASEYAQQNVESAAELSHRMMECQQTIKQAELEYAEISNQLGVQRDNLVELVESNKHFTTPAKYINELPDTLRSQNGAYLEELEQMAGFGKQMGVLVLSAAIEAGRMGENGKQFVQAAEEVRNYASMYESAVSSMMEEVNKSNEKMDEMEEQIHYLVGLLKESNIAATKLMKNCEGTVQCAEKAADYQFSNELSEMKGQITGLLNTEEEIVKSEERNLIQLSDIAEEFQSQKEQKDEVVTTVGALIDSAVEYNKGETR